MNKVKLMVYHIVYKSIELAEHDYQVLDDEGCDLILSKISFKDGEKGFLLIVDDYELFENYVDLLYYLSKKVDKSLAKSEEELIEKFGSPKEEKEFDLSEVIKLNSNLFLSLYVSCYA